MRDLGGIEAYFLVGPTASGKGRLAQALAERYEMEIVSMDSMKVYRFMDVGTAKPPEAVRARLPHHLIDVVDPGETFDLARWIEAAEDAVLGIAGRGKRPLFCGGAGLYLKGFLFGVFEGPGQKPETRAALEARARAEGSQALHEMLRALDPEASRRIHPGDVRRLVRALEVIELTGKPLSTQQVQFSRRRSDLTPRMAGLRRTREEQVRRIEDRVDRMISAGWLEEVRRLWEAEGGPGPSASQAVGYRVLRDHLEGGCTLAEAVERVRSQTRKLAKRQRTWFRSFPDIRWIDVEGPSDREEVVQRASEALGLSARDGT